MAPGQRLISGTLFKGQDKTKSLSWLRFSHRMRRISWSFVKPLIIISTPLALLPLPLVIKTKVRHACAETYMVSSEW